MARLATDEEQTVYSRLMRQITGNRLRNQTRSTFAEAEALIENLDYTLPGGRRVEQTPLHWPQRAIEVFSSRAQPRFYSMEGGESVLAELQDEWTASTVDFAEQLAIQSALRHGPAFIFTSAGDEEAGEPKVVVAARSARSSTAEIDPRTRRVIAALEILEARTANLYLPNVCLTVERVAGTRLIVRDENETYGVPCAPYINGATIERPFGVSRITKPVMGFTKAGMRTLMRQEVSSDWYSHPRERLLGVGADAFDAGQEGSGWSQSPGDIQGLPDVHMDDDPNVPDALRRASWHVTPQMSMQPFSDQFRLIASQFSGASSIPMSYLGIVQDSNPTSAAAIEAQDIDLVRAVTDSYPSFNMGRLALAVNILQVARGEKVDAREVRKLTPRWSDAKVKSTMEQSQFVVQQIAAGNFQAGTKATLDLLPMSETDAALHAFENKRAGGIGLLERIRVRTDPNAPATAQEPAAPPAKTSYPAMIQE